MPEDFLISRFLTIDGYTELEVLKLYLLVLQRLFDLCQVGDEFLILTDQCLLLASEAFRLPIDDVHVPRQLFVPLA